MDNRRQHERSSAMVRVDLFHNAFGHISVHARDISDGGMSVDMGNNIPPPPGTIVQVKMRRITGTINEDAVEMQVVHVQGKGVGLKFTN